MYCAGCTGHVIRRPKVLARAETTIRRLSSRFGQWEEGRQQQRAGLVEEEGGQTDHGTMEGARDSRGPSKAAILHKNRASSAVFFRKLARIGPTCD